MANAAEQTLLEQFSALAGPISGGSSAGLIEQMTKEMGTIAKTPQPVADGQAASSSSSKTGGASALSIASTVLESGLGIVPLIGGLVGLFGGGGSSAEQPLTKYALPDPVSFQGAETGGGIGLAGSDLMGLQRPADVSSSGSDTPSAGSGQQITVQVQAMDARSFMDRSSDIAAAVRDAMLNLNSINDVVTNL